MNGHDEECNELLLLLIEFLLASVFFLLSIPLCFSIRRSNT
jgi:hypothetical protein